MSRRATSDGKRETRRTRSARNTTGAGRGRNRNRHLMSVEFATATALAFASFAFLTTAAFVERAVRIRRCGRAWSRMRCTVTRLKAYCTLMGPFAIGITAGASLEISADLSLLAVVGELAV